MFLLDTNVVSALIRQVPEPLVMTWLNAQDQKRLYTSVITIHEIRYGIEKMADGRRKRALDDNLEGLLAKGFDGHILCLDVEAARAAATIQADRERAGRPIGLADCLIAGIAASRKAAVVTRNARDFVGLDVRIIDPWAG